jgi:hypothetical protein
MARPKKHFDSTSRKPKEAPAPGVPIPQKEYDRLKEEAKTKKPSKGCKGCSDPSAPK